MTEDEIIGRGRACIRLIEATDVLLQSAVDPHDRVTFAEARERARQQLRELVRDLDPAITAHIMAASDKKLGTARDVTLN